MSKMLRIAQAINWILLLILLVAVVGFVSFANIYGMFLALVTTLIAYGVYRHNRWAYFSAAAWALACYQLAKQGYEFESIKRYVMLLGFCLVPVALFLHEMLGKKPDENAQNSSTNASNKNNIIVSFGKLSLNQVSLLSGASS